MVARIETFNQMYDFFAYVISVMGLRFHTRFVYIHKNKHGINFFNGPMNHIMVEDSPSSLQMGKLSKGPLHEIFGEW